MNTTTIMNTLNPNSLSLASSPYLQNSRHTYIFPRNHNVGFTSNSKRRSQFPVFNSYSKQNHGGTLTRAYPQAGERNLKAFSGFGVTWGNISGSKSIHGKRFSIVGNRAKGQDDVGGKGEQEVEEEVEMTWIQEKAEDIAEFTESVALAIPGPRVGDTKMPWLVAAPLAYLTLTFFIAILRSIKKMNTPKEKKRRRVKKNLMLCKALDELLKSKRDELSKSDLEKLMKKTSFSMEQIFRKYIWYSLNEKPFNLQLVTDLGYFRSSSALDDAAVSEVLNEISRRIVKDKGPVVMNTEGFTEEGFKRKVAVQALFSKILYLSELEDFCPTSQTSLKVQEIFGVADEDVNSLRIQSLVGASDVRTLQNMVDKPLDSNYKSFSDDEDK